jgi:hypothetical protein
MPSLRFAIVNTFNEHCSFSQGIPEVVDATNKIAAQSSIPKWKAPAQTLVQAPVHAENKVKKPTKHGPA